MPLIFSPFLSIPCGQNISLKFQKVLKCLCYVSFSHLAEIAYELWQATSLIFLFLYSLFVFTMYYLFINKWECGCLWLFCPIWGSFVSCWVTSTSLDFRVCALSYSILCCIRFVALKGLFFSVEKCGGVRLGETGARGVYEWNVGKLLVRCIVCEETRQIKKNK